VAEYVPSRREQRKMIERQGIWLVLLTIGLWALIAALVRKGVLNWSDLAGPDG